MRPSGGISRGRSPGGKAGRSLSRTGDRARKGNSKGPGAEAVAARRSPGAVGARENLSHFVQLALDMGAKAARLIDAGTIKCEAWVRLKCQYGCPGYNKRLMCPPFTPTPAATEEVLACYRRAVLLHAHDNSVINRIVPRLEHKIFLAGYFKALGFGSGPCRICEERGSRCDTSKRCKYPLIARPAMEACGINVFDTARSNGFHIEVVRSHSQADDYFGVVLID